MNLITKLQKNVIIILIDYIINCWLGTVLFLNEILANFDENDVRWMLSQIKDTRLVFGSKIS